MPICSNCEHPIGLHGKQGCQDRYLADVPVCGCAWHENATPAVDRQRQCRAEFRAESRFLHRCQLMVTERTTHEGDHRDKMYNWTDADGLRPDRVLRSDKRLTEEELADVIKESQGLPASDAYGRPILTRDVQVDGDHYTKFPIQPWDIWEAYGLDPWKANVVKYLLRAGHKGPAVQDLRKARHYLDRAIERAEEKGE